MSDNTIQLQSFLSRQVSQIRQEGWVAIQRKIKIIYFKMIQFPFDIIGYTLAVPIVLFVRLKGLSIYVLDGEKTL